MKKGTQWGLVLIIAVTLVLLGGVILRQVITALEGGDIWAGFMGNFISGLFTLIAGVFAIILYFIQERQANVGRLIEWMSTLAERYHADEEFKEVRVLLAMDRGRVRDRLFSETALNEAAVRDVQLAEFQDYLKREHAKNTEQNAESYWIFQRRFTDYLYFFEQVLAHGELLRDNDTAKVGAALVDHFGWFLRSLYHCCDTEKGNPWEARQFFVYYLAHNRYRRLAEVGLFLLQGEVNSLLDGAPAAELPRLRQLRERQQKQLDEVALKVCAILKKQRGEVAACDLEEAVTRWGKVLFAPAPTAR